MLSLAEESTTMKSAACREEPTYNSALLSSESTFFKLKALSVAELHFAFLVSANMEPAYSSQKFWRFN